MGGGAAEPAAAEPAAPLSESTKRRNILSMLGEGDNLNESTLPQRGVWGVEPPKSWD